MLKIDYQAISPSGLSTTRVVVIGESLWQWSIMIDAAVGKVTSINGERVWKETRKSFHLCLSSLHLKLEPLLTLPFFCCSTTIVKFSCFSKPSSVYWLSSPSHCFYFPVMLDLHQKSQCMHERLTSCFCTAPLELTFSTSSSLPFAK